MSEKIEYAQLIDEAMHAIVQKALLVAEKQGLNGGHHFFISFLTQHPDVRIPAHLKAKYPEEMTIVLQYQFEKLKVTDEIFTVSLSFEGKKEQITVPFSAMTAFADPSVKFGLQFRNNFVVEDKGAKPVKKSPGPGKREVAAKKSSAKSPSISASEETNVVRLDMFRKDRH